MTTSNPPSDLIAIDNLTKIYETAEIETHALSGINLQIRHGEYVAIVGPSGSGKTTLLAILGLMDRHTGGRFVMNGTPVEALDDAALARLRNECVGFIFQTFNLIGDLSVEKNVELPLLYRRVPRAERKARVARALERVQMDNRKSHMPAQLSGGQQQRVAVARALVGEPSVLLADEPTGNLDSANGAMIMDLIEELHAAGATVCMVTHDTRFAERAARRVTLHDGRISKEAS
jgi:putative ABC transport system ATP-binding protein